MSQKSKKKADKFAKAVHERYANARDTVPMPIMPLLKEPNGSWTRSPTVEVTPDKIHFFDGELNGQVIKSVRFLSYFPVSLPMKMYAVKQPHWVECIKPNFYVTPVPGMKNGIPGTVEYVFGIRKKGEVALKNRESFVLRMMYFKDMAADSTTYDTTEKAEKFWEKNSDTDKYEKDFHFKKCDLTVVIHPVSA